MELLLFIVVGVFILLLLKNEEKFSVMTPLVPQISEGIVPTNNNTMNTHKIGVLDFPNVPKVIKLDDLPDCTVPISSYRDRL